jgi:hypothetical protein
MAEGYVYEVRNGGVSISTAITVIQIKAGASALEILRASIAQRGSTTSTIERIGLVRKSAAATVTSATPIKLCPGDPASLAVGGTSATGITASAEGTDGDILVDETFNIVNGTWAWLPTPEERIRVPQGGLIALKFLTAPGAQTWYASVKFRELQ